MNPILVDSRIGSKELLPLLRTNSAEVVLGGEMLAGDFAFEGRGPGGTRILIGIERKKVRDLVTCIESGRFSGHQLVLMHQMYQRYYLIVEGIYGCGQDGILEEPGSEGWRPVETGGRRYMHSTLERFLMSVEEGSLLRIHRTSGKTDTARKILNLWHFWNDKDYDKHKATDAKVASHIEIQPWSLKRRLACDLPGIGEERSKYASRHFKTGRQMLKSLLDGDGEWLKVPGVGKTIIRNITVQLDEETTK